MKLISFSFFSTIYAIKYRGISLIYAHQRNTVLTVLEQWGQWDTGNHLIRCLKSFQLWGCPPSLNPITESCLYNKRYFFFKQLSAHFPYRPMRISDIRMILAFPPQYFVNSFLFEKFPKRISYPATSNPISTVVHWSVVFWIINKGQTRRKDTVQDT